MGRRKIRIEPLQDERNRTVTFVKRKAGLFKKAHELAVLCQVDLALIIINPTANKIYEYSSVDTAELIAHYQRAVPPGSKPHESKGPEHYGNYRKKQFLNESRTQALHVSDSENNDFDDSDHDEITPESTPHSKATPVSQPISQQSRPDTRDSRNLSRPSPYPLAPATKNSQHVRSASPNASHQCRPVLRVQIPQDSQNLTVPVQDHLDSSARTITATARSDHPSPNRPGQASSLAIPLDQPPDRPVKRLRSLTNVSAFNTHDSRRPKLPFPSSKSQVLLPIDGPSQLGQSLGHWPPLGAAQTLQAFYPQHSSPTFGHDLLPTPVLNQVFSQFDANAPPPPSYPNNTNGMPSAKYRSIFNGIYPPNNAAPEHADHPAGPELNNENAPPVRGEQTPMLLVPMRYTQDVFPSPSNFYAQDWTANGLTGMTPVHAANILLYFLNMSTTPNQGTWAAGPGPGQASSALSHSRAAPRPVRADQPSPNGFPAGYNPNLKSEPPNEDDLKRRKLKDEPTE